MIIDSHYEVIEKLGEGLWATVYNVKDLRTDDKYTLKIYQNIDPKSLYERFTAEKMHHITKIQHENLIRVIDFGNFEGSIYQLSEYYNGRTLNEFKFNVSNLELLYELIVQICYGLSALHSQNIIHQDLKPGNIIYSIKDNKPHLKIMDYGFLKIDFEKKQKNISTTLPYIAPEIYLENEPVNQSDFFSLGVVLYKIVTGILPYSVEQISNFIAGRKFNLLPKFPRELNPDVPIDLEKLIMKLLERIPEDRFINCEQIIASINRTNFKQFKFSDSWSLINNIKSSDYIVREDYSHQLLGYIPMIEEGNGKIIILNAGRGLGKTGAFQLFRYHLLENKYLVFDYKCGPKNKDPFFALIKEFYHYIENNENLKKDLVKISQKLKEYLNFSVETADKIVQNKEELNLDFKSASSFIFHLAEEKPLIFVISGGEHLKEDVIEFLNHISSEIVDRPILIILGTNDPRSIETLIHPVQIKMKALTIDQTKKYVTRLLKVEPPQKFVEDIWKRSNGNPLFIEKILLDLTKKSIIWKKNRFNFSVRMNIYKMPEELLHAVYLRMAHLSAKSYTLFQKLAFVKTPLSMKLIKYVLEIDEKELFFLIKDGTANELFKEIDGYYYFTYREAVDRLNRELDRKDKNEISKKIIEYFSNVKITHLKFIKGAIKHAYFIRDYFSVRKFMLREMKIYIEQSMPSDSFRVICSVVELDYSKKFDIPQNEIINDINLLLDRSLWGMEADLSLELKNYIKIAPDSSEKNLLLGIFYKIKEKNRLALSRFESALKKVITGKQRTFLLLEIAEICLTESNIDKLGEILKELESIKLTDEDRLSYICLKAMYVGITNIYEDGISLIEEFISKLNTHNNDIFIVKLGQVYNNLGYLYRSKKILSSAEKNYQISKKLWEKVKYYRKLPVVYNNLGDVYLTKGDTKNALDYFLKGLETSEIMKCKRIKILSLLNYGEVYIKLGEFKTAEKYLMKSLEISSKYETKPFFSSIINNLAIAKSKIIDFSYYLDFIKDYRPEVLKGRFAEITPLIKTYFYFLLNIGNHAEIRKLLNKYQHLFFDNREQEFFYQIKGFSQLYAKKYTDAITAIEQAYHYSKKNSSVYAQAINGIRIGECYIALGNIGKAMEAFIQAESICESNKYSYWLQLVRLRKIKTQLMEGSTSHRIIIRNLYTILENVQERSFFLLELEVYEILSQIYGYIGNLKRAKVYQDNYNTVVKNVTKKLDDDNVKLFMEKIVRRKKKNKKFSEIKICPIDKNDSAKWQEELYDILKIRDIQRMKFFLNKTIDVLLSPYFYAIVLREDVENKQYPFLAKNISQEKIYRKSFLKNIEASIEKNEIIQRKIGISNVLFVPLRIKSAKVGCLVLGDKGELKFLNSELAIVSNLKLHLSSILIRIKEFTALNNEIDLMTKLIEINQVFFSYLDIERLEPEIVSFLLDFIGGTRGFLIKRDKYENYVYSVALDDTKDQIKNYHLISKTILSEVQKNKEPLFVRETRDDDIFQEYKEQDIKAFSIYCEPILLNSEVYGYLYIDNLNNGEEVMSINKEFMRLLMIQISVAIKNAIQYKSLKQKTLEITSLDKLKTDFINIVSHELKTPLVTLKGYVGRLPKMASNEAEKEIVSKIDTSVGRLYSTTNSIINHSRYILVNELPKSPINIVSILESVMEEGKSLSVKRRMQFKMEIEKNIPQVAIDWEAFNIALMHLVRNAIRFTKDFGTIRLGARRSAFHQEEVNNKESVVIYIQDNGIGIPKDKLTKVFQTFYELNEIYSHKSGIVEFKSSGLGLGLSTAAHIVNLHDGKIWINSVENEGTTVFVALPYIQKKTGDK